MGVTFRVQPLQVRGFPMFPAIRFQESTRVTYQCAISVEASKDTPMQWTH